MDLAFYPDCRRARALDVRMRSELAHSLEHIITCIQAQQPASEAAQRCCELEPALALLRSSHRVSPLLFASYYQLVLSVLNGNVGLPDDISRCAAAAQPCEDLCFHDMSEDGLGGSDRLALYRASLDTDPRLSFEYLPPHPDESARTRSSVLRALALMRRTVPELAGEFEALVVEVLLAAASKKDADARFDGASSYMLWGALALSVDDDKSDLEMMETLAHEAGHSFLFGLTVEEPLVRNDEAALYPSPLRTDLRPMDGIFHATYVSARMHYAMNTALNSGQLDQLQRTECETRLRASVCAFRDGHGVVAANAELSATGRDVMQGAYEYMEPFAG